MLHDPTARRLFAEARFEELRRAARRTERASAADPDQPPAPKPLTRELARLRWLRAR